MLPSGIIPYPALACSLRSLSACSDLSALLEPHRLDRLFIRLRTTLEFEADKSLPGVQAYYDQLEDRDNQRAVRGVSEETRREQ